MIESLLISSSISAISKGNRLTREFLLLLINRIILSPRTRGFLVSEYPSYRLAYPRKNPRGRPWLSSTRGRLVYSWKRAFGSRSDTVVFIIVIIRSVVIQIVLDWLVTEKSVHVF
jgi:hypothetical protein